jgi:hypothetical protein
MLTAAGERTFCRAKDLLSREERATARQVVNVLGRWQSHAQWNEIGVAKELDKVDATDGFLAFRRSRVKVDPDRSPMRRAACRKLGQAQRFLLKENVGALPFRSAKLAASVGATVAELNREPISELACDIVFDVRGPGTRGRNTGGRVQRERGRRTEAASKGGGGKGRRVKLG